MTIAADLPIATPLPRPAGASGNAGAKAIVGPRLDVLLLGGASLILVPIAMMLPAASLPALAATMMILADFLNHPHFAASYQIFYRNYRQKAFGTTLDRTMRLRYLFAGIGVPVILMSIFAMAFLTGNPAWLGYTGNAMAFLVGWHYTKQGYGMLMVDSVFKRKFFNDEEKRVLRYNAILCWLVSYLSLNLYVAENEIWGISYYAITPPTWLMAFVVTCALVTTAKSMRILVSRMREDGKGLPAAGTVAYLVSLYFWAAGWFNPAALLVIPAFHALQYMVIVYRFEHNRAEMEMHDDPEASALRPVWHLVTFLATAVFLGALGFWMVPTILQGVVAYDTVTFGPTAFLFIFWIFINLHHYFLDNVMWRRENPEAAKYLFGAKG
ncbi:MAG: hypothetical protein MUE98_06390 [Rhodobacteraceae bacterium]|jgi:hypothetical protein|nr:hypothetical protein [Paracoccaceae bacterium]